MSHRAKIIATLGPASEDKNTIRSLLTAGMDVARINFSHGDHEDHARVIQNLREAAQELNRPITILQDLSGPKIRTGKIKSGSINLVDGNKFILTSDDVEGSEEIISVNYPDLALSAKVGGRILLDDGKLELLVKEISRGVY